MGTGERTSVLTTRTSRWGASVAAVLLATAGCGDVRLKAPRVALLVDETRLLFAGPRDRTTLETGGETVLTVTNDSSQPRRIVLARVDATSAADLPPRLRHADDDDDDDRIVSMSAELDPKEATFAGGGLGFEREAHQFHVYLDPDETYVLFDSMGGAGADTVFLRFRPRPGGTA